MHVNGIQIRYAGSNRVLTALEHINGDVFRQAPILIPSARDDLQTVTLRKLEMRDAHASVVDLADEPRFRGRTSRSTRGPGVICGRGVPDFRAEAHMATEIESQRGSLLLAPVLRARLHDRSVETHRSLPADLQ